MKNIWLLTKVQLGGIFDARKMFNIRGRNKNSGKSMIAIFILLTAVLFGGLSALYTYVMVNAYNDIGMADVIPTLWLVITCIITLFSTVYKVKGILFQFADYDMVMALPVPTVHIVASRILLLYIYNLYFAVIFLLPSNIVYGVIADESTLFFVISSLLLIFVPMVPLIIGTVAGTIIAAISSMFKHRDVANVILSVALFVAVMAGSMKIASFDGNEEKMLNLMDAIMDKMYAIYPLAKHYMEGAITHRISDILYFAGFSLLSFVVYCYIIGALFKKLNTIMSSLKSRSNYKFKELKTSGFMKSLYMKELKRYFASSIYVLNTAIGAILMTIATIAVVTSKSGTIDSLFEVPMLADNLKIMIPLVLLIGSGLTCTTAVSISIEGKQLWVIKSLPVSEKNIFLSKALVNLTITVPTILINGLILSWKFKASGVETIVNILLPLICSLFMAMVGLWLNLKFPRFDWKSEIEVVKQGIPTLLALVIGFLIVLGPIGLFYLLPTLNPYLVYAMYMALVLILSMVVYAWLMTKGTKVMKSL